MVKAPAPPPALTVDQARDYVSYDGPLWRIFRSSGEHATSWNRLRRYGPVPGMRFDPYVTPPQERHRGVLYAASDVATAFAEVFQGERVIDRYKGQTLVGWLPSRPLRLLDFTGTFLVRNGASAALATGAKRFTRAWAELVDRQLGADVDGLVHPSAMTGRRVLTLLERSAAIPSFPARPGLHRALDDPLLAGTLGHVAKEIGYRIR